MNKVYHFLLVPFLFLFFSFDCAVDFNCKAVSKAGKKDYNLEMKLKAGSVSENFTLELFDLNTGSFVDKRTMFFNPGDSKVVFENVKPSTYTVYFSSASCSKKKSIKGTGIVLQ